MYVTNFSALLPPLLLHFRWSTEQLAFGQQHICKIGLCILKMEKNAKEIYTFWRQF